MEVKQSGKIKETRWYQNKEWKITVKDQNGKNSKIMVKMKRDGM